MISGFEAKISQSTFKEIFHVVGEETRLLDLEVDINDHFRMPFVIAL